MSIGLLGSDIPQEKRGMAEAIAFCNFTARDYWLDAAVWNIANWGR